MNTNTPPAPAVPATPAPPQTSNVLNTYEDCATLVASAIADTSNDGKDAALKRLQSFFEVRINKKAARDEREGAGAVKRAIEGKRTFKQWSQPPKAANETPGGGLFNA